MEPALGEKFMGTQPNRFSAGWGDFAAMIEVLEAGVESGPWLLGEEFSAADVMVGSGVQFMHAFDMLPDSPPLRRYMERCSARPACRAAIAALAPSTSSRPAPLQSPPGHSGRVVSGTRNYTGRRT